MEAHSRKIVNLLAAVAALGLSLNGPGDAQETGSNKASGAKAQVTVKGYVIDSACTFRNDLKKPVSSECAAKCAKAGSPLVIQSADGTIYWPISADMPATGQNDGLMPYAGKMVTVRGKLYTKGGSKAIVIEKIDSPAIPEQHSG